MHILYLHQYFVPRDASGGTRSYEFARRLVESGHNVCMITSSAMIPDQYGTFSKTTTIDIDKIRTIIIPVEYSNEMSYSRRIWAFTKFALLSSREAMLQHADVVFATSTPLTIAIPGIAARIWHRIPMVFEVRDLWPEKPIAVGALRNPVLKCFARDLEWIAYHASAHVVVLSPGAKHGVERRGIPLERISSIPNSCDLDLFDVPATNGQAVRQRLGLRPGQPLIVYTGTLGHINGVGYAVEMAKKLYTIAPDVHILLIGDGAEREQLVVRARKSGVLDHNLSIWPPIAKTEMPQVLAAATLATSFVIPIEALWDNSANKFFDALAAGKPIAINYGGWQADLLNETGAGIVLPPDNPTEGARLLAAFVHDHAHLQAASEAARHLARTRFDRDEMARQLEAILRSVVEK